MLFRFLALACTCMLLAGCNQISAVFASPEEKTNAAFPLPDVAVTAYGTLLASFENGSPQRKAVTEEYVKLMRVRALTCTAQTPIGRWDTIASIRAKALDTGCFQKQDVRLAEWIGLQRLSQALGRPALAALSALPDKALLPNFAEFSGQVTVAAEANVMVVKGTQKFIAVQLPSGKPISSLPIPEQTYRPASVSANGHVLAVPVGSRNLRMFEVESGNLLWSTEEYSDLIAWLPQVQAALLTQVGSGSTHLLDTKNAKLDAFPSTEKRLTWALPVTAASGRYLVGEGQTVSQMNIMRTDKGVLEATPLQQWRLNGNGISYSGAFLMEGGARLVYPSGSDLAWFTLADQQQGAWQLSALGGFGFTKLNEKNIVFDGSAMGTTPAGTRVLNIADNTVAVATNIAMRDGPLTSLLPRAGYLKRSDSSVSIGTSAEVEAPQSLEKVVSEALLAKQLAKVAAASTTDSAEPPNPYHEALAKQVRAANVASAVRDGLPRDVIESIRNGTRYSSNTPSKAVKPMLTDVPANARVSVVGVYEGTSASTARNAPRTAGSVRINVQPGSTPLVLVLASYEPVHWLLNTNGRKISKILTSGYYDSTVMGVDGTPVIKIGSHYAYKLDSNEYNQLKQGVALYVENPIQLFQGSYTGREFSVQ